MKTPLISAAALAMLMGCTPTTTPEVTATTEAMCDVWEGSLPSRSAQDTEQTRAEIGRAYDVFEAVCERPVE